MTIGIAIYIRERFAYNSCMLMIVLKFVYFLFLILFVHLSIVFTGILSFLKVNFFGL